MIKTACTNYNLFKFIKILYDCTLRLIATLKLIKKSKPTIPLFFPDNYYKESNVSASKKSSCEQNFSKTYGESQSKILTNKFYITD